ncbi:hypothetical protein F2P56_015100 [Juglans regia]|uniref:Retrotransposon Copia-like N-terminal domain-containing protein n=1 Tax=Juglans regia TaxID=51240 RepID=A0A834CMB7_JUGRE|nr:hypothetical protein F2P56_015100 [Juglans regia]
MASSSSSTPIVFNALNVVPLISVKMDGENYLNWISQCLPALRSHDLVGFVDGSEPCPEKHLSDSQGKHLTGINPAFLLWHKKDQFVLGLLNSTLANHVLPSVYGLNSAKQICADNLATAGKPVEEEDLISYIIGGLNPPFNPFIVSCSFALRNDMMSLDDFQLELLSYEILIENQNHGAVEQQSFAMMAPSKGHFQNGLKKSRNNFPPNRNSFPQRNLQPKSKNFGPIAQQQNIRSGSSHQNSFQ